MLNKNQMITNLDVLTDLYRDHNQFQLLIEREALKQLLLTIDSSFEVLKVIREGW